jgi:ketosteroid isomerase-like protein
MEQRSNAKNTTNMKTISITGALTLWLCAASLSQTPSLSAQKAPLPPIIEAFINATNGHDAEAFVNTFAQDALVNDFGRNFWGKSEIKKWSDKEIIGDRVTFRAVEIKEIYGDFFITALTDGAYDKSKSPDPTYLDYLFTVRKSKIVKLIVIKNKERSAKLK